MQPRVHGDTAVEPRHPTSINNSNKHAKSTLLLPGTAGRSARPPVLQEMPPVTPQVAVQQQLNNLKAELKRTFDVKDNLPKDLLAITLDKIPTLARPHVLELWLASFILLAGAHCRH